jgi:hypothetical protein
MHDSEANAISPVFVPDGPILLLAVRLDAAVTIDVRAISRGSQPRLQPNRGIKLARTLQAV